MEKINNRNNLIIQNDNKQENNNNQNIVQNNDYKQEYKEKSPLIPNKKLIKIINDMNNTLNEEENKKKYLEDIYKKYNKKDLKKEKIKHNNNAFNNFMFIFVAGIFVIINLMGIYTIRDIMDSLFEVFKNSIQYFLWKKSDLESKELTDFESRFNSSYNFYGQYFTDISKNKVNFDLIMFWDFIGSLFYYYYDFTCSSIFFFLLNLSLIIFIRGFNFLDIDNKTHKYSFFQILSITLIFLFLWISIGSSALLSQQIYIDSYNIYKQMKKKKKRKKEKKIRKKYKPKKKKFQLIKVLII